MSKGRWITLTKDFLGEASVPWRAVYVTEDEKPVFSLIGMPHEPYRIPCLFEIIDYRTNEIDGYFGVSDLKKWFDANGIANRPHYHEIYQKVREVYKRRVARLKKLYAGYKKPKIVRMQEEIISASKKLEINLQRHIGMLDETEDRGIFLSTYDWSLQSSLEKLFQTLLVTDVPILKEDLTVYGIKDEERYSLHSVKTRLSEDLAMLRSDRKLVFSKKFSTQTNQNLSNATQAALSYLERVKKHADKLRSENNKLRELAVADGMCSLFGD